MIWASKIECGAGLLRRHLFGGGVGVPQLSPPLQFGGAIAQRTIGERSPGKNLARNDAQGWTFEVFYHKSPSLLSRLGYVGCRRLSLPTSSLKTRIALGVAESCLQSRGYCIFREGGAAAYFARVLGNDRRPRVQEVIRARQLLSSWVRKASKFSFTVFWRNQRKQHHR